MEIIDKLAAFDQTLPEEEKVTKLIGALPLSFELFAFVSNLTNMNLDLLVSAVYAEIVRRKYREV